LPWRIEDEVYSKIDSDHRLILTLNLGDSDPAATVLISSPMNKIYSKTARLAPIQSAVRIRQPGHMAGRGNYSRSPRPIVICLTWQYSRFDKPRSDVGIYSRLHALFPSTVPQGASPVSHLLVCHRTWCEAFPRLGADNTQLTGRKMQ
jgi:hypothetical protein